MEKVNGIGGFFFRARNPEASTQWYRDHLGVTPVPQNYDDSPWRQDAGPTAFASFPYDPEGNPIELWQPAVPEAP